MTRASVPSGFPGIGQDVFPEQAREFGRQLGLYDEEAEILEYSGTSSGGSPKPAWTATGVLLNARIDPVGTRGGTGVRGGAINEASSHIVSFEEAVAVTAKDRVRIEGLDWVITALRVRTDELITRVEVKQV